jgi:hypothetical protein
VYQVGLERSDAAGKSSGSIQGRHPGYAELFHRHPIFLYAMSDVSVFMKQTNNTDFMFLSGSSDNPFKDLFSATLIKLSNYKKKTHC